MIFFSMFVRVIVVIWKTVQMKLKNTHLAENEKDKLWYITELL